MKVKEMVTMLLVDDVQQSIDFYKDIIDFNVAEKLEHEGKLNWVNGKAGNVRLMITLGDDEACAKDENNNKQRDQLIYYFYPEDVNGLHAELKGKGYQVTDLRDTFYEMREFDLRDPDGNLLCFGQCV